MKDLDLLPHEWWDLIRASGCTFTPITCHILAQVCSTSPCERNWSSYSFIHNKVPNRLTLNRMEDLVYIYINNKLLRKQPNTNPMAWYEKNMLSENSMFDVDESVNESNSLDDDPIMLDD